MLASLLRGCGLFLGNADELIPPTRDNPEGHWENQRIVDINDALLAELGGGWDHPPVFAAGWKNRPRVAALRAEAREVIARFAGSEPWGWKDPRASLTLGFWRELIPDLRVVICLRNPAEVAMSLRRRGLSSWQFGFALWRQYNERVMRGTTAAARIVTHYEAFFLRPEEELRRVLGFAGLETGEGELKECVATITAGLRHHRSGSPAGDAVPVPAEVQELYLKLCDAAEWDPAARLPPLPAAKQPVPPEQELELERRKAWRLEMEQQQSAGQLAESTRERVQLAASLEAEIEANARLRPILGHAKIPSPDEAAFLEYEEMVATVRHAVQQHVPAGAKVLVVSKGDERLLALQGRAAFHFPGEPDGTYSGHHPEDGDEALALVKKAVEAGARYLVFPAMALWWLDFYEGLRAWLGEHCTQVSDDPEVCRIFAMPSSFTPTATDRKTPRAET